MKTPPAVPTEYDIQQDGEEAWQDPEHDSAVDALGIVMALTIAIVIGLALVALLWFCTRNLAVSSLCGLIVGALSGLTFHVFFSRR